MITLSHPTTDAVLAVVSGTPLLDAAMRAGMTPADLADAVDTYHAAGHAALSTRAAHAWYQAHVHFTDWTDAEAIAVQHVAPTAKFLLDGGLITAWWYVRKYPCWRIRWQPAPTTRPAILHATISTLLDDMAHRHRIDRWCPSIYEPEVPAFGGPTGMDIAHRLFHADSISILDYLRQHPDGTPPAIGRREIAVLLCTALFRGAGQEWHEQGDIWYRVTLMRPLPPDTPTGRLPDMTAALRRLLAADGGLRRPNATLAFAQPWATAFTTAGTDLHAAARDGHLHRGLRDVLAHHVIFHFNRLGVPDRQQAILARAAYDAVMNPPAEACG